MMMTTATALFHAPRAMSRARKNATRTAAIPQKRIALLTVSGRLEATFGVQIGPYHARSYRESIGRQTQDFA
jgi:hypothetical protein